VPNRSAARGSFKSGQPGLKPTELGAPDSGRFNCGEAQFDRVKTAADARAQNKSHDAGDRERQ